MSVHRTRSGKFEVKWREGARQRSKTFSRKADADRFDREVKREHEQGRPLLLRRDVPTFGEFAEDWIERRVSRAEISKNTELFDAALLDRHIDPFIGHLSLIDLTPRRLDAWQRQALEDGTPYMVQRATQLLGRILDVAVRIEYLPGNPARSLARVKHQHQEGLALAPVQVEELRLWFLSRDRIGDATLISVMAYAGPRPEEALAMRWRNLSGRRYLIEEKNVDGELVPDPKTGHRWIELPEAVVSDLAEWRLAIGRPQGLVFPKPNGLPWTKSDRGNWRRRWFSKAAKAIGHQTLKPRDLRHTCTSLLAAVNTPRIEIEAQMGHRADTSERIYQHLIEELRGTKLGLDELIGEARRKVFGREDVRRKFGLWAG
ncbi:MAG: tyrosine-type recombinase/integrase [Actinomycetota bacterium]|nr:tyrosine-type recombinase/integrase [Actinomycetota bacterium]